jgi:hypothetical protein
VSIGTPTQPHSFALVPCNQLILFTDLSIQCCAFALAMNLLSFCLCNFFNNKITITYVHIFLFHFCFRLKCPLQMHMIVVFFAILYKFISLVLKSKIKNKTPPLYKAAHKLKYASNLHNWSNSSTQCRSKE